MMNTKIHGTSIFPILARSLLLSLLLVNLISINAQEVENEREFDYTKGSEKGPERWGDLHSEWKACKNGKMQSPIDMANQRIELVPSSKRIHRNYRPQNATLHNRGHDIMLQWEGDAGSVMIIGREFALQQAHWHSPSEHTINGRRYALELHMVHRSVDPNSNERIAVIAVLYKIGTPNPFLSKLAANISSVIDQGDEHRHPGVVNPMEIKISGRRFYKYVGSLTVPPCTEGVLWTISKKIRTVSIDQVKLLREAVHDYAEKNARPPQKQNHREVHLYGPDNRRNI